MSEVRRRMSLFSLWERNRSGAVGGRAYAEIWRENSLIGGSSDQYISVVASAKGHPLTSSEHGSDWWTSEPPGQLPPSSPWPATCVVNCPGRAPFKDGALQYCLSPGRKLGRVTRVVISEVSLMGISTETAAQLRSRLIPFLCQEALSRADAIVATSRGVADNWPVF